MTDKFDNGRSIIVPVRSAGDLPRVVAIANRFAELLDRDIEVFSVLHPGDDYALETERLAASAEGFSKEVGRALTLRTVVDANRLDAFLRHCTDHLVCMATSGSPFERDHYVGSHAASLLAASRAPVIMVGPAVNPETASYERVVIATTPTVDSHQALIAGRLLANALGSPIAKVCVDERGVVYETDYAEATTGVPREVHASMVRGEIDDQLLCDILVERSKDATLVLATRANRGLAWICDGSVAFDAVRHAHGPVVALGPKATLDDWVIASGQAPNTEPANAT